MKTANSMIQDFARTQRRVQYIDVASAMFDSQGNLPGDLFVSDGLHPTAKCYALWTSIIKPILLTRFGGSTNASASSGKSRRTNTRTGSAPSFAILQIAPGMPN